MNLHSQHKLNIKAIIEREKVSIKASPLTHKAAHKIAKFSGTVYFIVVHLILFSAWIALNIFLPVVKLDPYPFTFLTMLVSLESIFLSGFIMLSQNELSKQTDARAGLDLEINLLAEAESTAILKFLIKMGKKMGMSAADWAELQTFADEIDPEKILQRIEKIEDEDV